MRLRVEAFCPKVAVPRLPFGITFFRSTKGLSVEVLANTLLITGKYHAAASSTAAARRTLHIDQGSPRERTHLFATRHRRRA